MAELININLKNIENILKFNNLRTKLLKIFKIYLLFLYQLISYYFTSNFFILINFAIIVI